MLGVSGIVPDGVEAVFVAAPEASATRADVRDNGYAFVLPRQRRPEPRYVVWTGQDGTPHVQPLGSVVFGRRDACPVRQLPPNDALAALGPRLPHDLRRPSQVCVEDAELAWDLCEGFVVVEAAVPSGVGSTRFIAAATVKSQDVVPTRRRQHVRQRRAVAVAR